MIFLKPTVRIDGKVSIYCLYSMKKYPLITILGYNIWKKVHKLFHILHNNVDSMEISKKFRPDPKLKLIDQVRQVLRYRHYAYRTEQTYCDWIICYIRYHGSKTHPRNMVKRKLKASYPIWRFKKRSPPPPSVRRLMECARLCVCDKDIFMVRSPLDILTIP